MATPISNNTLNFSVSNTTSIDRNANTTRFTELLHGQMRDHAPETPPVRATESVRTTEPTRTPEPAKSGPVRNTRDAARKETAESHRNTDARQAPETEPESQTVPVKESTLNPSEPDGDEGGKDLLAAVIDAAAPPGDPATIAVLLTLPPALPAPVAVEEVPQELPANLPDPTDETGPVQHSPVLGNSQKTTETPKHALPQNETVQGTVKPAETQAPIQINSVAMPQAEAKTPLPGHVEDTNLLSPINLTKSTSGVTAPQFSIPVGAGQKVWAEEIGNRVMWMLGRAETKAELILTPPNLGKVEVSIHLNGDQGTAQFLASTQTARDALEQAMPRLRELLAQAGINLGEASVNTSAEGRDGETAHQAGNQKYVHDDEVDATAVTATNWTRLDNGLVNTFA